MLQKALAAVNDALTVQVDDDCGMLCVQLAGTFTGLNLAFEARVDNLNGAWVPVEAARNAGNTVETSTGVIAAAPAYVWDLSIGGFTEVRVRVTAITSGSVNVSLNQYAAANEIAPVVPAHSVVLATPTATNQNSAASTNALSVKNSAGTLMSVVASNTNAAARFLKLYNKASAPTVGTDVPVLTIPIPAASVVSLNFGTLGHRFSTGIAAAITGAAADTDTTAIAANEVKVLYGYQ